MIHLETINHTDAFSGSENESRHEEGAVVLRSATVGKEIGLHWHKGKSPFMQMTAF